MNAKLKRCCVVVSLFAICCIPGCGKKQNKPTEHPIFDCITHSNEGIVLEMLKGITNVDSLRNSRGDTPLIVAARRGWNQVVMRLLALHADVNIHSTNGLYTPLIAASMFGQLETARILITNGADVNAVAIFDHTALMGASITRPPLVEYLTKNGAEVNRKMTVVGHTPLFFAAMNNQSAAVETLLEKGAEINGLDRGGRTPLILACQLGHADVVRVLLVHHADKSIADPYEGTAIEIAKRKGRQDLVKLLEDSL